MNSQRKEILDDRRVDARQNGVPLRFERRRYGNRTYCWLEWYENGEWHSAGDPWPSVNIPQKDLQDLFGPSSLNVEPLEAR